MLWHTMKILRGKQRNSSSARATMSSEKGKVWSKAHICTSNPSCPPQWPLPSPFTLMFSKGPQPGGFHLTNVPGFVHFHPCCTVSAWIPAASSQPSLHDTSLHADLTTPVPPPLNPFSVHHCQCFNRAQKVIPGPCILLQPHLLQLSILSPYIFKS